MTIDTDQMAMTAHAPTSPTMNPTVVNTPVIVVRARKAPDFQVRTRCRCCEVSVMGRALRLDDYRTRRTACEQVSDPGEEVVKSLGALGVGEVLEDPAADRAGDPHRALDRAVDEAAPAQGVVGPRERHASGHRRELPHSGELVRSQHRPGLPGVG